MNTFKRANEIIKKIGAIFRVQLLMNVNIGCCFSCFASQCTYLFIIKNEYSFIEIYWISNSV